jgi:hypothetical protein
MDGWYGYEGELMRAIISHTRALGMHVHVHVHAWRWDAR